MPTHGAETEQPGVGAAAKQVAEHASALAKLELELAGLELKQKAGAVGAGVGLGVGAAVVALLRGRLPLRDDRRPRSRSSLDTWLALLIVTLGLFAIAARARAGRGAHRIKRAHAARSRAGDPARRS